MNNENSAHGFTEGSDMKERYKILFHKDGTPFKLCRYTKIPGVMACRVWDKKEKYWMWPA
jgi:hypothetical protein